MEVRITDTQSGETLGDIAARIERADRMQAALEDIGAIVAETMLTADGGGFGYESCLLVEREWCERVALIAKGALTDGTD